MKRDYAREWRERNPEKVRNIQLLYKHAFAEEEIPSVRERQRGPCEICGEPENRIRAGKPLPLSIDHDHSIHPDRNHSCAECRRGFLCHDCNVGLGKFKDSAERLRAAAEYLERYRCL